MEQNIKKKASNEGLAISNKVFRDDFTRKVTFK